MRSQFATPLLSRVLYTLKRLKDAVSEVSLRHLSYPEYHILQGDPRLRCRESVRDTSFRDYSTLPLTGTTGAICGGGPGVSEEVEEAALWERSHAGDTVETSEAEEEEEEGNGRPEPRPPGIDH